MNPQEVSYLLIKGKESRWRGCNR